jgi:gas vesicle protein
MMSPRRKNMSKKGNKFLWGLSLGALFGVLFAPRKGDDTRKKLAKEAEDLKGSLEKAINAGTEKYQQVKTEVDPVINEIKTKSKPYIESLKDGLEGKEDTPKKK